MILGGYCRRSSDILDFADDNMKTGVYADDPPLRLHLAQGGHRPAALARTALAKCPPLFVTRMDKTMGML